MMLNISNSDLDLNYVLTIVNTVIVTGNKGTQFSFLKWRQYILCSEVNDVPVPCTDCPDAVNGAPALLLNPGQVFQDYWKMCIEDEIFLIPKQNGCIEGYLRTKEQQDFREWKNRFWTNQPKDYKQAAYNILGREINTGNPDIANQEEYDRLKGKERSNDGKNYGRTARDPEEDAL